MVTTYGEADHITHDPSACLYPAGCTGCVHPDLAFTAAAHYVDAVGDIWEFHHGVWGVRTGGRPWFAIRNSISSINGIFGPLKEL